MPCITVFIPGIGPNDRIRLSNTKKTEGDKFIIVDASTHIQEIIQHSALAAVTRDPNNKLTLDDFWVYVVPTPPAPAVKITIEALQMPGRNWAWQKNFAETIANAAGACCNKYAKHVVVFTHMQIEIAGFAEIEIK